jgi:hypothetical protein
VSETNAKVLVPKGWKRCPACSELVKGPRTGTCPHCKADISKASKAAKPKAKPGRPAKAVAVAVVPKSVDPYTFNTYAVGNYYGVKGSISVRHASGRARFPNGLKSTLEYLMGVSVPETVVIPNFIEVA